MYITFAALVLLVLVLPLTVFLAKQQQQTRQYAAATGVTYYVSMNGSNADGLSWTTAWNELNKINWAIIQPGDTILIDGGATACPSNYDFSNHSTNRPGLTCGMLYTTQLNIQKSGIAAAPITIKLSTEAGHNGTAVVFGGRTSALPYCTQNYTATGTARTDGIVFNTRATGASYITIDGSHRSGIMVYGAQTGVNLISDNSTFDTLRNMEIFDNGNYTTFSGGGYRTDYPGIFLNGNNITIDKTLIHDNGQDEIQDNYTGYGTITHAPMHDMAITNSWLYNHRESPVWPGYPFNSGAEGSSSTDCTHVDGIQIYGGGLDQQGFTFDHDVFGPLLAQGVYPGDENNTSFDNVTISNVLFLNAMLHNIEGDPISTPTNNTPNGWKIQNVTSYLTNGVNTGTVSHGFGVWGQGHGITNSIFQNGYFAYTASFTGINSGNLYYGSEPVPGGTNTNPNFVGPLPTNNAPSYATLVAADFTPQCGSCAGKGSSIHKVQDLLNIIDSLNAATNPTPTNNTPTSTPTSLPQTATINASPASVTLTIGSPTTVNVTVNGGGQAFNAAQATVTVSANLSVTGLSITPAASGGCNFSYTQTPTTTNPSFAGAILASSSTLCTVYALTLNPTSAGTGTISFTNGSVKAYATNGEILSGVTASTSSPCHTTDPAGWASGCCTG